MAHLGSRPPQWGAQTTGHGLELLNADVAVGELGAERYYAEEVWPQVDCARKAYVPFEAFAYPNCRCNDETDALFREKGFEHVRGGVKGATPYDPDGVKLRDEWPLSRSVSFIVTKCAIWIPAVYVP